MTFGDNETIKQKDIIFDTFFNKMKYWNPEIWNPQISIQI